MISPRTPFTRLSAFAFVVALPSLASANTLLPSPTCTNLTDSECEAVAVLFKDSYARASAQPVALVDGEAEGAQTNADKLELSAVRLATKVQVRATLRGPNGSERHAVEMTATSLDDMPQVAQRMSHALVHRTGVEQTQTLRTITRTEASRPNRIYSEKVFGLKTGFIKPLSTEVNFNTMISLQFDARFEADTYFLEFGGGLVFPSDDTEGRNIGGAFAEFGGSYYLNEANVSPYVGGGVSPRLLFTASDAGVRAAVYGQFGLMFMRFSSTRLYTELRVTQNVMGIDVYKDPNADVFSGGDKVTTYPTEVGLNVGIGW